MKHTVVIGGGPSGLTAAYELTRHGAGVTVLERLSQVGGLARTIAHDECLFDIGPHRFFTKNDEIRQLFLDILAEDVLVVPRLTRILYKNRLFNYPITPFNALSGLGPVECVRILTSYFSSQIHQLASDRKPENFADWMTDKFGSRLFEIFFKTYTEKVWGIPCSQIEAEWAGQRIKGLSLAEAIRNAFSSGNTTVKSLVNEFLFPRLGAGQLYEKMAHLIEARGGTIQTDRRITQIRREGMTVRSVISVDPNGLDEEIDVGTLLSSAPLTETVGIMYPPAPENVLLACQNLRYRNHLGVHFKLKGSPFPDNWIYVHSKEVQMARLCNYRNFSREMAGGENVSPLTVEYFSTTGDSIARLSDQELMTHAANELKQVGFLKTDSDVLSGFVVRSKNAYPVMKRGFDRHVSIIKSWLDQFTNLMPIGRSGMFKYNNQDHAMATGLLSARNVLGMAKYDPWLINIDAE